MRTNRSALLPLLLLLTCYPSFAQKPSCDELNEILRVESWRVPMPADKRYFWHIDIVDYNPPRDSEPLLPGSKPLSLDTERKALVALRPAGKDTYETTVKTSAWVAWGAINIDVCTEKEKSENRCDNTYNVKIYAAAKPSRSGPGFLLADIMKGGSPRKQIVLKLAREPRRKAAGSAPAP